MAWVPAFAGMTGLFVRARHLGVEVPRQVKPVRVSFLDRRDLPGAFPGFHALFQRDGLVNVTEGFVPAEPVDFVAAGEAAGFAPAMLFDAPGQVVGDPDVEGAVFAAGEDVDVVAMLAQRPAPSM